MSLLQRGVWTRCSWKVEQYLAERFAGEFGSIGQRADGGLGFEATPVDSGLFSSVLDLCPARFPAETDETAVARYFSVRRHECDSASEREFLKNILIPAFGFPLIDFLQIQPGLESLGLSGREFCNQRADFAIDDGFGLKLIVELDGGHHLNVAQEVLDQKRNRAFKKAGWETVRMPIDCLASPQAAIAKLAGYRDKAKFISEDCRRSQSLFDIVWGATVVARIQFLILMAIRRGLVSPEGGWTLSVEEHETDVKRIAISDFEDWYSRLGAIYSLPRMKPLRLVDVTESADLHLSVSVCNPAIAPRAGSKVVAKSIPYRCPSSPWSHQISAVPFEADPSKSDLEDFVRDLFRKPAFRDQQFEITRRILMQQNVLGLLPTGGGKSLPYQLAAMLLPGATIYVAPLKSLLEDQADRVLAEGIDAVRQISSRQSAALKKEILSNFAKCHYRILMVAPERLLMPNFRDAVLENCGRTGSVAQIVVDECHCVSEWGHDFRPAYLSLGRIVQEIISNPLKKTPIVALTGTASSIVLEDVERELGLINNAVRIRADRMDRPEIELVFWPAHSIQEKRHKLVEIARDFWSASENPLDGMLVFTRHSNGPYGVIAIRDAIAKALPESSVGYFCGTRPVESVSQDWEADKVRVQQQFLSGNQDNLRVLVATKAFGMGVDKPSIRRIVHLSAPESPEAYYQEVGRAARDRKVATAYLLFGDASADRVDKMLSPDTGIEESRSIFRENQRGRADFILNFYFHEQSFPGLNREVLVAGLLLKAIEAASRRPFCDIDFVIESDGAALPKNNIKEQEAEKALVKLMRIGVVRDYEKLYNERIFRLKVNPEWQSARLDVDRYRDFLMAELQAYFFRYGFEKMLPLDSLVHAESIEDLESLALQELIRFFYDEVERKQRSAMRTMLEIARNGLADAQAARAQLLKYLQSSEKFGAELEEIARLASNDPKWITLLARVRTASELDELRGAVSRLLESFPTHPGLLLMSALSRRQASMIESKRSLEEFRAARQFLLERFDSSVAIDLVGKALAREMPFDKNLMTILHQSYADWCVELVRPADAIMMVPPEPAILERLLARSLDLVRKDLPGQMK